MVTPTAPDAEQVIPEGSKTHDNTMMAHFNYCERLYAISHVLNRTPRERSAALGWGGLVHVGMNGLYTSYKEDDDREIPRDPISAFEQAVEAMRAAGFVDPEDDFRTLGRAESVLKDYVKKYVTDPDITKITFTETAFDVVFPDGFRWGGIMDLWSTYHDEEYPVEHKTTSRFGGTYYDEFRRSPQPLGYCLAGAHLRGEWPSGVLYNVIINRKASWEFDRRPVIYPGWLVEECRDMQIENYKAIAEKRARTEREWDVWDAKIWRPNLYNCVGKYGKCAAFDICHCLPENRERVLNIHFEEKEWNWREVRD